jgi:hypothetical protein
MDLYLLILSLPTQNSSTRMRVWRALKSCGAAVLRDGVYVLPDSISTLGNMQSIADDVISNEGTALIFQAQALSALDIPALFDRREDYEALHAQIQKLSTELIIDKKEDALKQSRKLRKHLQALIEIDFFPSELQLQISHRLHQLELTIARLGEHHEPVFIEGSIPRLKVENFQNQVWATRQRPWVDRLASAWLIKRFIDPAATILWLETPEDCPANALGFDFNGAMFSHVDHYVTFEVLMHRFSLETPALKQLANIVHFLDVGGIQPTEAAGIERVLQGLRSSITDDDQLLLLAGHLFDGLHSSFQGKTT